MGPNKDEILKNAERLAELERQRKALEEQDQKPTKMTSSMPLGCWLWIALAVAVAIWLLKRYGSGI